MSAHHSGRRAALALLLILMVQLALPVARAAQTEHKVVRVGWYESAYCYKDRYGKRRGIAYNYQCSIAAHTGWTYEYVEDSWPNLLQMLMDGEIDLLSDVSYTDERSEQILYPALPMGSESYYIFAHGDNDAINPEDIKTLNGKRIGVNQGSYQEGLLHEWAGRNGIDLEVVPVTGQENESMDMLGRGDIDGFVSLDSFSAHERVIPVCKVGGSDYYFAVNRNRPDLLSELNQAMSILLYEDPYYNQRMVDQYIHLTTTSYLTPSVEKALAEHGAIRVGYWDNYLSFCATDPATGELTGALRDYLAKASNCLTNADVRFEALPYPSLDEAFAGMERGEVDSVFPVNMNTNDGEERGLLSVGPVMQTDLNALVRQDSTQEITQGKAVTVAIDQGNLNFDTLIIDDLPNWNIVHYDTMEDCYRAVAEGEADCAMACNYRMYVIEPLQKKYRLVSLPSGETLGFSFSVSRDQPYVYSVLNKIAHLTPKEDMEYALLAYMYSAQKVSLMAFLQDHWMVVILVLTGVFAVVLFLLIAKLNAERKVIEQQKEIETVLRRELAHEEQLKSVTRIAYTDPLTRVKSKYAFQEAEVCLEQRLAVGDLTAFGIVIFDVNDLKKVNDTQGHQQGDLLLQSACKLICVQYRHSPVYRIGGDEFAAILEGSDYDNREALLAGFDAQMEENRRAGVISVSCGMSIYRPGEDSGFRDVLERADEAMYQRKHILKQIKPTARTV